MSPCQVDPPSDAERAAASKYFEKTVAVFNALTCRNDRLREVILNPGILTTKELLKTAKDDFAADFKEMDRLAYQGLYASPDRRYYKKAQDAYGDFKMLVEVLTGEKTLTDTERARIVRTQNAHRIEDLKRLAKIAVDKWDMDLLKTVTAADPTKPLGPQLGFDPDSL